MPAVDAAAPPTNINYGQSQEEFIRLFFEKEVLSQRIVQLLQHVQPTKLFRSTK